VVASMARQSAEYPDVFHRLRREPLQRTSVCQDGGRAVPDRPS
jgi:hypothetical protein